MTRLMVKKLNGLQQTRLYTLVVNSPKLSDLSMQERQVLSCIANHHLIYSGHDHSTPKSLAYKCNLSVEDTEFILEILIKKGILYIKGTARFINFDFFKSEINQVLEEKENKVSKLPLSKIDQYRESIYLFYLNFCKQNPHLSLKEISDFTGFATGTLSSLRSNGKQIKYKLLSANKWKQLEEAIINYNRNQKNRVKRPYTKKVKQEEVIQKEIKQKNSFVDEEEQIAKMENDFKRFGKEFTEDLLNSDLLPKSIFESRMKRQRLDDVKRAIDLKLNSEETISIEWIEEYNQLIKIINLKN